MPHVNELNILARLRQQETEIAELKAEIEHLSLLLALTLARGNIARNRFIEVAQLLRQHEPKEHSHGHRPSPRKPQPESGEL